MRPKQNRKPKPHLPSCQGKSNLISTQYTRTHLEYVDLCLSLARVSHACWMPRRSRRTCMLSDTSLSRSLHRLQQSHCGSTYVRANHGGHSSYEQIEKQDCWICADFFALRQRSSPVQSSGTGSHSMFCTVAAICMHGHELGMHA